MQVTYLDHMGDDATIVNAAPTPTKQRLVEAVKRGYGVSVDGIAFGPKGPLKVARCGNQRYPTFTTNWNNRVVSIPVHMLAAYCFYGNKYLYSGMQVRHLDGNTLNINKANIVLGTSSENQLDKPKDIRSNAAKKARASQGFTPLNAKLTEEQVKEVRDFYQALGGRKASNGSVAALGAKLGVSRTVLIAIKNGKHYGATT
jgi:HNH endonuclease